MNLERDGLKGKRVFVVGSGGSLLDEDLSLLDGQIVMGVGQSLAIWKESPLTYSLYAFHAIEEQRPNDDWARALGIPLLCGYQEGDRHGLQAYDFPDGYKMVFRDHAQSLHGGCLGDVDGDFTWAANSGSVGLALGVQTAMWLGAGSICLLGHDFNPRGYVSNLQEPRGGDAKVAPLWEPGGKRLMEIEAALRNLQARCGARGTELQNCTNSTSEEVLEKRSLREVIDAE